MIWLGGHDSLEPLIEGMAMLNFPGLFLISFGSELDVHHGGLPSGSVIDLIILINLFPSIAPWKYFDILTEVLGFENDYKNHTHPQERVHTHQVWFYIPEVS